MVARLLQKHWSNDYLGNTYSASPQCILGFARVSSLRLHGRIRRLDARPARVSRVVGTSSRRRPDFRVPRQPSQEFTGPVDEDPHNNVENVARNSTACYRAVYSSNSPKTGDPFTYNKRGNLVTSGRVEELKLPISFRSTL
jgi:hypothetical protein